MKKTITTCDFCGKDAGGRSVTVFHERNAVAFEKHDMCEDCWNNAIRALTQFRPVQILDAEDFTE